MAIWRRRKKRLGMGREDPGSRVRSWTPCTSIPSYGSVPKPSCHFSILHNYYLGAKLTRQESRSRTRNSLNSLLCAAEAWLSSICPQGNGKHLHGRAQVLHQSPHGQPGECACHKNRASRIKIFPSEIQAIQQVSSSQITSMI